MLHANAIMALIVCVIGVLGAIFATEFRAGITGTTYVPSGLDRIVVVVIFAIVAFMFIFSGLGSPRGLRPWNEAARTVLEVIFVIAGVRVLARSTNALLGGEQPRAIQRKQAILLGLIFSILVPLVVVDIIHRIQQLTSRFF
jgi:hypothetical protein